MKIARAVIGANFGDEGKGLVTDYLVTEHQSDLVIRFNGGSQAGHTVVTPDGRRHVFSHFGSGSFSGAATLLSRFFIVNPMIYVREQLELAIKFPQCMDVKIDLNAPVTTPFDMMLNQMAEQNRGGSRHGSCGLGIGETIERSEKFLNLKAEFLTDEASLREMLLMIRQQWVPTRKKQLGLDDSQDRILMSDALIENYLADVRFMIENTELVNDAELIRASSSPVFEGAQGLLLDQEHEFFPHVTRSNTGIQNVLVLANESGIREVEAYYTTRSYLTRHGAGPLSNELDRKPFLKVEDQTNITNDWQGSLRFAHLDTSLVKKSIISDLLKNRSNVKVRPRLVITCLDQVDAVTTVYHEGRENFLKPLKSDDVGDMIAKRIGFFGNHLKSFGPTQTHVVDYIKAEDLKIEMEDTGSRRKRKVAM